jgi:hypothetical protein
MWQNKEIQFSTYEQFFKSREEYFLWNTYFKKFFMLKIDGQNAVLRMCKIPGKILENALIWKN